MAERTNAHVLGATLIGGMIGAGLALLFAPRSGRETREQIHHKVTDAKQRTQAKLGMAKSKVQQSLDEARDLKDRLQEAAHSTGKKARNEIEELQDKTVKKRRQSPVLSAWEEEV